MARQLEQIRYEVLTRRSSGKQRSRTDTPSRSPSPQAEPNPPKRAKRVGIEPPETRMRTASLIRQLSQHRISSETDDSLIQPAVKEPSDTYMREVSSSPRLSDEASFRAKGRPPQRSNSGSVTLTSPRGRTPARMKSDASSSQLYGLSPRPLQHPGTAEQLVNTSPRIQASPRTQTSPAAQDQLRNIPASDSGQDPK